MNNRFDINNLKSFFWSLYDDWITIRAEYTFYHDLWIQIILINNFLALFPPFMLNFYYLIKKYLIFNKLLNILF